MASALMLTTAWTSTNATMLSTRCRQRLKISNTASATHQSTISTVAVASPAVTLTTLVSPGLRAPASQSSTW